MEMGDVLIFIKLDWLERDAIDVCTTAAKLEQNGTPVFLALGGVDMTSLAGRLTKGVVNTVAHFERGSLVERSQLDLARAKPKV